MDKMTSGSSFEKNFLLNFFFLVTIPCFSSNIGYIVIYRRIQ